MPTAWEPCAAPLATGTAPAVDVGHGLLALAQVLTAGAVVPPWNLGLTTADFADTFNMNMGYVDAFRLWLISAFDDRPHMRRCVGPNVPPEWDAWLAQEFHYT